MILLRLSFIIFFTSYFSENSHLTLYTCWRVIFSFNIFHDFSSLFCILIFMHFLVYLGTTYIFYFQFFSVRYNFYLPYNFYLHFLSIFGMKFFRYILSNILIFNCLPYNIIFDIKIVRYFFFSQFSENFPLIFLSAILIFSGKFFPHFLI